eukprot:Skav225207  [mRNA]  locus=scaffold1041:112601:115255:- [translate_table: standard]
MLRDETYFDPEHVEIVDLQMEVYVSQVAGLLTDNFALKRMYVASEALNLVLAVAMFVCGQHHSRMLFALNVGWERSVWAYFSLSLSPSPSPCPPLWRRRVRSARPNSAWVGGVPKHGPLAKTCGSRSDVVMKVGF